MLIAAGHSSAAAAAAAAAAAIRRSLPLLLLAMTFLLLPVQPVRLRRLAVVLQRFVVIEAQHEGERYRHEGHAAQQHGAAVGGVPLVPQAAEEQEREPGAKAAGQYSDRIFARVRGAAQGAGA